MISYSN